MQIGALTNWAQVSAGYNTSLAVKTDGTLWAWGRNNSGQLGDNTLITKSSPVQIGALTNWAQVSGGGTPSVGYSLAVKTDGTLWAWGANNRFGQPYGTLGDGTIIDKSSPVQIGALTNWAQVSAGSTNSLAVKTDGTLWAWGLSGFGELGDGTTIGKSSPVQIGALTGWNKTTFMPGVSTAGALF